MPTTQKEQMECIIDSAKEYSDERLDAVLKIEKVNEQLSLGVKINPYLVVDTQREVINEMYEDFYDATILFMKESNGMSVEEKEAYRDDALNRLHDVTAPLAEKVHELEEQSEAHFHWYNKCVFPEQKTEYADSFRDDREYRLGSFLKLHCLADDLIRAVNITGGNQDLSWYELKENGVISTRELSKIYSLSDYDEAFDSPEKYWEACEEKAEKLSKTISGMGEKLLSGRLSDKALEDFFSKVEIIVDEISVRDNNPKADAVIQEMKKNIEEISCDLYQEIDSSKGFKREIEDNATSRLKLLSNDITQMSPYIDEYTKELFVQELAKAVEVAENRKLPASVQNDVQSEIKECIDIMGKSRFEYTLDELRTSVMEARYGKEDIRKALDIANNYCLESGVLLDLRSFHEVHDDMSLCLSSVDSMLSKSRMFLYLNDAEYFAEEDFRSGSNEHSKDICKYAVMGGIEYKALDRLYYEIKNECEWMMDHAENEREENRAKESMAKVEKIKTSYLDPAGKKLDSIAEAGRNDPDIVSVLGNVKNGTLTEEQANLIADREKMFLSGINGLEIKYIRPSFKQTQQEEQSLEVA